MQKSPLRCQVMNTCLRHAVKKDHTLDESADCIAGLLSPEKEEVKTENELAEIIEKALESCNFQELDGGGGEIRTLGPG